MIEYKKSSFCFLYTDFIRESSLSEHSEFRYIFKLNLADLSQRVKKAQNQLLAELFTFLIVITKAVIGFQHGNFSIEYVLL